jgi:hypothetical protein
VRGKLSVHERSEPLRALPAEREVDLVLECLAAPFCALQVDGEGATPSVDGEAFNIGTRREARPTRAEVNVRGGSPSGTSDRDQREANRFAAELLMPDEMVRSAAAEIVGDRTLVSDRRFVAELARRFEVSGQAMEFRLVKLPLMSQLALAGG